MRAAAALVVLAVLLAGCARVDEPEPPAPSGGESPSATRAIECPPTPDILVHGGPPRWYPGRWWNYTLLNEEERVRGFALFESVGCADVAGTSAYVVRETFLEFGAPPGYPETPRVMERAFDMTTLNEVWARCDEPRRGMYPCEGRLREWDFPLEDGKRWTYPCCGDVVSTVHARSELAEDGTWRIHLAAQPDATPYLTWAYDPGLGLFTEKLGGWGNGPGRWELAAHGIGAPPPRAATAPEPLAYEAACVHEEARGPAASAALRGAWRATPEGLIVRLAAALNETLVGAPAVDGHVVRWSSARGNAFEAPLREPGRVTWRATDDALPPSGGEAWLRAVVERFGFGDATDVVTWSATRDGRVSVHVGQEVAGQRLAEAGAHATSANGTVVSLAPLYDVAEPTLAPEDAVDVAAAYARCALAAEEGHRLAGASEAPELLVRNGSLAYRVSFADEAPEDSTPCARGARVLVDAITGAVLGHERARCV